MVSSTTHFADWLCPLGKYVGEAILAFQKAKSSGFRNEWNAEPSFPRMENDQYASLRICARNQNLALVKLCQELSSFSGLAP
jgi:hypothetical protein